MKVTFIILFSISCIFFLGAADSTDWRTQSIDRYEEAGAELERVFQNLVTEIKQEHASDPFMKEWVGQIAQAQEAWKKFRDEDQQAAGFYWRGGGTGRAQTEWATRLTLQRIEDLKKRYDPR
jgi:uncharacterized protein YecT (DUF1311 family)